MQVTAPNIQLKSELFQERASEKVHVTFIPFSSLQVTERKHKGTYAKVYRAKFEGKVVALKIYQTDTDTDDPIMQSRAMREGEIWKQLKHPHIVPFIGITKKEKNSQLQYGLVLEYLPRSLREAYQEKP